MMAAGQEMEEEENELVELHIDLELDYRIAIEHSNIITRCIAEILNISKSEVFIDGVDEFTRDDKYWGLFRGHVPTTKDVIEGQVQVFYKSLQTQELHQKITDYTGFSKPFIEIHEIYETDQMDDGEYGPIDDEEQYLNPPPVQQQQQNNMASNNNNNGNNNATNSNSYELMMNGAGGNNPNTDHIANGHNIDGHNDIKLNENNSMESMLDDLKDLLNNFIQDTDTQFDQLLQNCQKQINEDF